MGRWPYRPRLVARLHVTVRPHTWVACRCPRHGIPKAVRDHPDRYDAPLDGSRYHVFSKHTSDTGLPTNLLTGRLGRRVGRIYEQRWLPR